jgi:plastocyanin
VSDPNVQGRRGRCPAAPTSLPLGRRPASSVDDPAAPTRRSRPAALLGVLLALLVVAGALAGCGGDDGGSGGAGADLSGTGTGSDSGDDSADGGNGDGGGDLPAVDDAVAMEGDEVAVTSLDNTFRAPAIEVRPGTTVVWTNKGRNEHDVLPSDGDGWGVEVEDFQPGDVYRHTFDEPGTYRYYCSIHGTTTEGMVGAVVVAE